MTAWAIDAPPAFPNSSRRPHLHLSRLRVVPRWLSLNNPLKERRPGESLSPICLLSQPLASIWPSVFFRFMALTLSGRVIVTPQGRVGLLRPIARVSSLQRAQGGKEKCQDILERSA
jgi:hypothetical protein